MQPSNSILFRQHGFEGGQIPNSDRSDQSTNFGFFFIVLFKMSHLRQNLQNLGLSTIFGISAKFPSINKLLRIIPPPYDFYLDELHCNFKSKLSQIQIQIQIQICSVHNTQGVCHTQSYNYIMNGSVGAEKRKIAGGSGQVDRPGSRGREHPPVARGQRHQS